MIQVKEIDVLNRLIDNDYSIDNDLSSVDGALINYKEILNSNAYDLILNERLKRTSNISKFLIILKDSLKNEIKSNNDSKDKVHILLDYKLRLETIKSIYPNLDITDLDVDQQVDF